MNLKKFFKFIKKAAIVAGIIIILLITLLLILHLREEKRWIFAKGSKTKAFLNSTWGMTEKEVERANKCYLWTPDEKDFWSFSVYRLSETIIDKRRFKVRGPHEVNLWNNSAKVYYIFFDDRLFQYDIQLDTWNFEELDSIVVSRMKPRFGDVIRDSLTGNAVANGSWEKDSTKIAYWQYYDKDNKIYKARIRGTNLRGVVRIEAIGKEQQNKLF